jgi:hypothetical protein
MHRPAKLGTLRRTKKLLGAIAWGSIGLSVGLTGAGCGSVPATTHQSAGEPLFGETPLNPAQPTPPANAQAWLAPIPSASGVATNASLASQTQSLAIGGAPTGEGWMRKIDGTPTPGQTPINPVSQQSTPRVEAVPKDNSFTAAPTQSFQPAAAVPQSIQPTGSWAAATPPAGPSADQLKQMLDARGVNGQQQQNVPGGILLRCYVTSKSDPSARQVYETTAADYATAVQAIAQQIDQHRP